LVQLIDSSREKKMKVSYEQMNNEYIL
jgi:hypothetical protein